MSLYDAKRGTQPAYGAGYVECLGCRELLAQQEKQRVKDAAAHRRKVPKDHPHPDEVERDVTGHRHWRVWLRDLLTPTA